MYVIQNANSKKFKLNGKTVEGSLMAGTTPGAVTAFTEDAKTYKSIKGARVAIMRLRRNLKQLVAAGAVTARTKDLGDSMPDYIVTTPKGKRM